MSFHAITGMSANNDGDEMDIEKWWPKSDHAEEALIDFASNQPLTFRAPTQLADLRTVLQAHGANLEDATLLDSDRVQFIPLEREKIGLMYACKDCGKMHSTEEKCGKAKNLAWNRALQKTGWEAAMNSWIRRGWRPSFDGDALNLEIICRKQQALASTQSNRHEAFHFQKRELTLISPESHIQDTEMPQDESPRCEFMPIWTKVSPLIHRDGNESCKTSPRPVDPATEVRRKQREAKLKQRVKDKAMRLENMRDSQSRFLQLHNQLHGPADHMNEIDVERKFPNPITLRSAIKRLELRQVQQMTSQFSGFTVESTHTSDIPAD